MYMTHGSKVIWHHRFNVICHKRNRHKIRNVVDAAESNWCIATSLWTLWTKLINLPNFSLSKKGIFGAKQTMDELYVPLL
jgi:hypothetical protein